MEKYVFSGSLTYEMKKLIQNMPDFEPLCMLSTQLDRSTSKKIMGWKDEGFCSWFFLDSGAFGIHTQNAPEEFLPENGGVDYYIDFINEYIDKIDICAQLDTIPGKFKQPKSEQDYIDSAEKSWENFLYMRSKLKKPELVMPVYHFGEDVKYLDRMLDYVDENGKKLKFIGVSPANDASTEDRMLYLQNVYDHIKASSYPEVKTHVYGFTKLEAMAKFPLTTADSTTHRLLAGYGKIITRKWGVVSVSDRDRVNRCKSNHSFLQLADEYNLKILEDEAASMGLTLEQLRTSSAARTAFCVRNIQYLTKTKYAYKPTNLVRPRKLF